MKKEKIYTVDANSKEGKLLTELKKVWDKHKNNEEEFISLATKPPQEGGLGMNPIQAARWFEMLKTIPIVETYNSGENN